MKIILIGYKGFIGSNLHALLNVKGLDVSVYSSTEINDNLNSRVNFSSFLSQFEKSIVINCAGNGNVQNSILNPTLDFDANVRFTQFILETIRISKKKCTYIHLSSAAVYGNPKILPIREDSKLQPISPYGYHKVLSENLCRQYAELYDLQSIVLRPFSVYGPGLRKQLIWDVHEKFYRLENEETIEFFGTGDETRDFIYIEDLCRIIELLVIKANQLSNFEVFNVSNEEEVKTSTIIELIAKRFDHKTYMFSGITREGDPKNWKGNNSKVKNLGYFRRFSLQQGLEAYTNWYLKSRIDK